MGFQEVEDSLGEEMDLCWRLREEDIDLLADAVLEGSDLLADALPLPVQEGDQDSYTVDAKEAAPEHRAMLAHLFLEQAAPKVWEMLQEAMANWPQEIASGD